jgi:hypothetical protein
MQRFDYQLIAKDPVTELKRYQVVSYPQYNTGPLATELSAFALQLPQRVNQRTYALANQWRVEEREPSRIIDRALGYFRDNPFYYTRQPPVLTGDSVVDQFLFETRRGFCEHFAASFVTLMRAAGVPARVVTGYQGGEVNALGDYLIVRQSDAHAWAEVWLEDLGWRRVDPTSVIPPGRVESSLDSTRFNQTLDRVFTHSDVSWLVRSWNRLGNSWDALNFQWNNWVLGYGREKQRELLSKLGFSNIDWIQMGFLLFIMLLLALLLAVLYLFWRQPGISDPVLRSYQRFCDKLARAGLTRMPNEGPSAFANRAGTVLPVLSRQITSIAEEYIALRYHHHPSKQEIRQFTAMVSQLKVPH